MATNFLHGALGTAIPLMTTELNTFGSGYGAISSVAGTSGLIDNTVTLWPLGRLELTIASNSNTWTVTSRLDVYFLPQDSAGNLPAVVTGSAPLIANGNYYAGSIMIQPGAHTSTVNYENLSGVLVPAGKYKIFCINNTGFAWPASGNTLTLTPTPDQY